jgi:hypothetical protein
VLKAFGAASWAQVSTDNDRRAEKAAIPVIQQRFANTGKFQNQFKMQSLNYKEETRNEVDQRRKYLYAFVLFASV